MPTCPICKKENGELLTHLHSSHDITDAGQYQELLNKAEKIDIHKREFANFVRQLQHQRKRGCISLRQFQESVAKWLNEHEEQQLATVE